MFLKHLINPRPSIILFFIVFCAVFICIPLLQFPADLVFSHGWIPPFIVLLMGLIIPSFHALGINNLIYEKNIIRKDNLVLGFVYLLLCTPFINTVSEWFASFFLLFFLNYILETYQKEYPFSQIFNATVILSLLSFVFPNLLSLALLVIISGINYSNLNWRNLVIACIGVSLPYFFYFIYTVLFNSQFTFPEFSALESISLPLIKTLALPKLIWICTLLIISLFSIIELFQWLYKKSIRSRKSFLIIFFYLALTLLLVLFGGLKSWYFIMTPLTVIIGNYFTYTKSRKVANFLFLMLIISSFYYRYFITL
jgi:hypothetical protein